MLVFNFKANIAINSRLTLFISQRHFLRFNFNINESTENPNPSTYIGSTLYASSSNVPLNDINHRFYNSLGRFELNHKIDIPKGKRFKSLNVLISYIFEYVSLFVFK